MVPYNRFVICYKLKRMFFYIKRNILQYSFLPGLPSTSEQGTHWTILQVSLDILGSVSEEPVAACKSSHGMEGKLTRVRLRKTPQGWRVTWLNLAGESLRQCETPHGVSRLGSEETVFFPFTPRQRAEAGRWY